MYNSASGFVMSGFIVSGFIASGSIVRPLKELYGWPECKSMLVEGPLPCGISLRYLYYGRGLMFFSVIEIGYRPYAALSKLIFDG